MFVLKYLYKKNKYSSCNILIKHVGKNDENVIYFKINGGFSKVRY